MIASDLWKFSIISELAKASGDLYQDPLKYSLMLPMTITKYDCTFDEEASKAISHAINAI